MIQRKKKDWFKTKKYPHIDTPISISDRNKIEAYIRNEEKISQHSFLPFIHKTSLVRRFRKKYCPCCGNCISLNEKGKPIRVPDQKKRELFYASYFDSLIYSYYSQKLSSKYELFVKNNNLNDVILAYRSIPVSSAPKSPCKCNIDFANDVFEIIYNFPHSEFDVIAFDITSYFDNLNHKILLEKWSKILDVKRLPSDHFNIFKNITRFSYIDIVDLFEEFKDNILTQKTNAKGEKLKVKKRKVARLRFMRNQNAIAFCDKSDFLKIKHKLIRSNKTIKLKDGSIAKQDFGIPQGSPISSTLANIYLMDFDKIINEYVAQRNGFYRRYSDDIVVISPNGNRNDIIQLIQNEISKHKLEIQDSKTQIFEFIRQDNSLKCGQVFKDLTNWNKNFVYLGFEFDGNSVLLKNSSISGYYRKLKRHVSRAKYYSRRYNKEIFKRRILKKFTYRGAKRTRKRLWNEKIKSFKTYDSYNYGNFLTYANKASYKMINNKIKNQLKGHWNKVNMLIKH
jgi:hypothetical protein